MLVALSDGTPLAFPDLVDSICDALRLDAEVRGRRLASGQTVMYNRVGWTRTNLAKAGLVDNPDASVVVLTDTGRAFLASHPGPVDEATLKRDCPSFLNWLADMGAIPAIDRRDRAEPTVWIESGQKHQKDVERIYIPRPGRGSRRPKWKIVEHKLNRSLAVLLF